MKMSTIPMLFLLALPSAAVAQGVAKPAPPAAPAAAAQASKPAVPEVPATTKLKIRDLQVQILAARSEADAAEDRLSDLTKQFSPLVEAAFKEAGLDREKWDLQLGNTSDQIKFVEKRISPTSAEVTIDPPKKQ